MHTDRSITVFLAIFSTVGVLLLLAASWFYTSETGTGTYAGTLISSLLALIFGGIGFGGFALLRRNRQRDEETRRFGQRIDAQVIDIERRRNIHVNGRNPFRIIAKRPEDNSEDPELFYSRNIWFDPTAQTPEKVSVYIDRNDPRRYVVDTDFLRPPR